MGEKMGRTKHKKQDRNQKARNEMEEKKIARERIEQYEKLLENNAKDIEKYKKSIASAREAFAIDEEADRIQLSGLKVINPTFEFERSEAWENWNKKSIEFRMKSRKQKLDATIAEVEEQMKSLEEQNERIIKENSELTAFLSGENVEKADYVG